MKVNILNDDDTIIEIISVSDQESFEALERLCDGFGYKVEKNETT